MSSPPLRERGDDLVLLAEEFGKRFAPRMGQRFSTPSQEDKQLLKSYDWPGNIRELQNVIERALILSASKFELARAMPRIEPAVPLQEAAERTRNDQGNLAKSVQYSHRHRSQ